jgi:hypothetical protein
VVPVSIVVAVLPDNDRFVTIPAVPIPIVFTVAVTIAITMNFAHGHAVWTYTDSDFFRAGRNCAADTYHGSYGDCVLNHLRAPITVKLWRANP